MSAVFIPRVRLFWCVCVCVCVCARVQAQQRTLRLLRVVVVIFARVFDLPHPFSPPPLKCLLWFLFPPNCDTPPHRTAT